MRLFLSSAIVALLMLSALPSTGKQSLMSTQSEITFTSSQMGVPVQGKFNHFDADVDIEPSRLDKSKVNVSVDVSSASFGAPELEAELAKSAWFDAGRFPRATFRSLAVRAKGQGRLEVAGKLTIKGKERDLVVPVAIANTATGTFATGAFAIKRLDFEVGEGEWKDTTMVSDDVQVRFKIMLTGKI